MLEKNRKSYESKWFNLAKKAPRALLPKYKLTVYIDRTHSHTERLQKIFLRGSPETYLQLNEFLLQDPALPPQAPAQLTSQTSLPTIDQ
jgi:hypothetical protein